MATNNGNGSRHGSVTQRTQVLNPTNGTFVKRNTETGRFIGVKAGAPFKGVAKEIDNRRK